MSYKNPFMTLGMQREKGAFDFSTREKRSAD
jgi:hypothetical protein